MRRTGREKQREKEREREREGGEGCLDIQAFRNSLYDRGDLRDEDRASRALPAGNIKC